MYHSVLLDIDLGDHCLFSTTAYTPVRSRPINMLEYFAYKKFEKRKGEKDTIEAKREGKPETDTKEAGKKDDNYDSSSSEQLL